MKTSRDCTYKSVADFTAITERLWSRSCEFWWLLLTRRQQRQDMSLTEKLLS